MVLILVVAAMLVWPAGARAQEPEPAPVEVHEHVAVNAPVLTPTQETTGTSWIPPVSPMYGLHRPWRGWDLRVNGTVFVQGLYEPANPHRTGGFASRQLGAVNWGMFAARRNAGTGRFGLRTMFSAEPWTVPSCGSLSVLATGEVCAGDTIHDRQQQHDLFMELAVDYERPLRGMWRWQLYAGLAGEPALGPPAYSHRASAIANPMAPVAHHWLDSAQVVFGVVTVGAHNQRWKAETSVFNGRAPDERRADVDLGAFDSFAARLSFLPTERLALQISAARLRDVATEFPFPDQAPAARTTASILYHRPLAANGLWATTLAVGTNHAREVVPGSLLDTTTVAALLESSMTFSQRHTVFGRGEVAGMPAHHLHAHEFGPSVLAVGKVQGGYVRYLRATRGLQPGFGGTVALSLLPPELESRYRGRTVASFGAFFTLQAARHEM
jgi:hypothetical protein